MFVAQHIETNKVSKECKFNDLSSFSGILAINPALIVLMTVYTDSIVLTVSRNWDFLLPSLIG